MKAAGAAPHSRRAVPRLRDECAAFFFFFLLFLFPSFPSPPRLSYWMVRLPHGWLAMDLQPLGAEPHECGGENGVAAPPLRSTIFMRAQWCMGASEAKWPTYSDTPVHGLSPPAWATSSEIVQMRMYHNENHGLKQLLEAPWHHPAHHRSVARVMDDMKRPPSGESLPLTIKLQALVGLNKARGAEMERQSALSKLLSPSVRSVTPK